MDNFIPLIPVPTGIANDKSRLRRIYRNAVESALRIEACATAIKPFKSNGNVCGHKVLDNAKAVEALQQSAPENLQHELDISGLSLYDKTQALDSVLRKYWAMDKKGKIDGTPAPIHIKHKSDPQT